MASSYKSEYPASIPVDEGIVKFFEIFYETSDTPSAHERYAESFTKDATLIMASKKSQGHKGRPAFPLSFSIPNPAIRGASITMSITAYKHSCNKTTREAHQSILLYNLPRAST